LRELLDAFCADVDAFLAELPSLPSLPASISLPRPHLPASLSAVSLLDLAHAEGEGEEEESSPTRADALLRADFGRKLIGYEDLSLEWRNNPWVVGGYRCVFLFFSCLPPFWLCFRIPRAFSRLCFRFSGRVVFPASLSDALSLPRITSA
jgi:hypothetical protein